MSLSASEDLASQSHVRYHLTFDIDWAPDFAIEEILSILKSKNVKATFFITHASDAIQDISNAGHEVGLHPNFLPNSSQGTSVEEVMDYLLNIYPNARSIRTHSLLQSSPLLHQIFSNYPQLKIDLSVLLYKFPLIAPSPWMLDGVSFTRLNYNWEDDMAFYDDSFSWNQSDLFSQSIIFDFHPIHVALNSSNNDSYIKLKESFANKSLFDVSRSQLLKFRNNSVGACDYLRSIISSNAQPITLREFI